MFDTCLSLIFETLKSTRIPYLYLSKTGTWTYYVKDFDAPCKNYAMTMCSVKSKGIHA